MLKIIFLAFICLVFPLSLNIILQLTATQIDIIIKIAGNKVMTVLCVRLPRSWILIFG